ncbi:DUF2637 domain-containing protein [Streptomyces sp. NPDC039016]|uniref:DUF2637 domain-containing protein n=1 Tax=Streptomyces sp. NPDC039016 TaxID=3154330 RepID=UPI00340EF52A
MATAYPTRPRTSGLAHWVLLVTSAAITAGFAYLAFRLSFAALTALGLQHGVPGDIVWMFAVLVDGGAVVGTVGVVMAQHAGRGARPYWATVIAFAAISLTFNIAHSDGTPMGIAIAVTSPVAQLAATELLVRLLPTPGSATAAAAAPSVAAAIAAADRATAAVSAITAAANTARAAADEAATAAEAAARATRQPTAGGTANGTPATGLDLATLIAAASETPPFTATGDDEAAPPEPQPLAATFTAPPWPAGDEADVAGAAPGPDLVVPQEWVNAYRQVWQALGKRPTQNALGDALGVKRTRASQIRERVEEAINTPCAVTVP